MNMNNVKLVKKQRNSSTFKITAIALLTIALAAFSRSAAPAATTTPLLQPSQVQLPEVASSTVAQLSAQGVRLDRIPLTAAMKAGGQKALLQATASAGSISSFSLMSATVENYGTASTPGKPKLAIENRPVWVTVYSNVRTTIWSPSETDADAPTSYVSQAVNLYDAITGEFLRGETF